MEQSSLIILIDIPILIGLLVLSYIFSGSEVALFSLSPGMVKKMKLPEKKARIIKELLSNQRRLLATILIGNTAVNSFASSLFAALSAWFLSRLHLPEALSTLFEITVFTAVLLIMGEVTPKLIALNDPLTFSQRFAPVIHKFSLVFGKFAKFLEWFERILPQTELEGQHGTALFDEIYFILKEVREVQAIEAEEALLIRESLSLIRGKVRDVMMPISELKTLSHTSTVFDAIEFMHTFEKDFVLVHKDSVDNIAGVVTPFSILETQSWSPQGRITDVLETPLFVLDEAELEQVWDQLRDRKVKLAVVVDEYGNTEGIVFLEDVVEKLLNPHTGIKQISPNMLIVDGDVEIEQIEDLLDLDFGYDGTVAGYLMEKLSRVPHEGEICVVETRDGKTVKFEVLSEESGKIKSIKIQKVEK